MKLLMIFNSIVIFVGVAAEKKELKQIVILSRHNLRTPFNGLVSDITNKKWPKWPLEAGQLTAKGEALELSMGKYFADWLQKEKFIAEQCSDDLYVYANTKQRTIATAQAFIKGFALCNTTVHYKGSLDPVFKASFKNNSESFKKKVSNDYKLSLEMLKLYENYELLQNILDYTNSNNCMWKGQCSLVNDKTYITNVKIGKEPQMTGPLIIAHAAVDTFFMEYYEGYPIDEITWGKISADDWKKLAVVFQSCLNVMFESSTLAARDISSLLLKNITNIFLEESPKLSLLVGHDVNLITLMKAMNFKDFDLGELEKTPCGSKLVFEKWVDIDTGEDLLKIEFIYRSKGDMRNFKTITKANPPKRVILEIEGCKVNVDGYCNWNDFMNVLINVQ